MAKKKEPDPKADPFAATEKTLQAAGVLRSLASRHQGSQRGRRWIPAVVLENMGLYWLNGSPSFFLRREAPGRTHFLEMGAGEVKRKLRVAGFAPGPIRTRGERFQISRILDAATETRAVDFAVSIGGTHAGVYDRPGGRVLVRESPRLIEPARGEFPTIRFSLRLARPRHGSICLLAENWLSGAGQASAGRGKKRSVSLLARQTAGRAGYNIRSSTPILAGPLRGPKAFLRPH